jgi:RNA polymerase sigma-70 factor (ECF subfamily)
MHGALAHRGSAERDAASVLNDDAPETSPRATADALIRAIAERRDREAFVALFQEFAPRLKSYMIRLGAPATQADELAQETLVAVWRKAHLFDPARASAATWIFRIARNLRLDAGRRDRSAASYEHDLTDSPEPPETPEGAAVARQRRERVRQALILLPPDQLDVLQLSFFQDFPHAEIAERLRLPLGTVKSRIRLALSRLRGALEGDL